MYSMLGNRRKSSIKCGWVDYILKDIFGNPVAMILLTLLALFAYSAVLDISRCVEEVYLTGDHSSVLLRAVTNANNHVHPWLATTVTIIVLLLIVVVIILYAGELDEI